MVRLFVVVAALCALLGAPAAAHAAAAPPLAILAANSTSEGAIDALVIGPGSGTVQVYEVVNGKREHRLDAHLSVGVQVPDGRFLGYVQLSRIGLASCTNRTREYVVTGTGPGGTPLTANSNVRTHSCRRRFKLGAPATTSKGRRVSLKVTDAFKLGDVSPKLCVKPPGRGSSCSFVSIPNGGSVGSKRVAFTKTGIWKVELRGPGGQVLKKSISVGLPAVPVGLDPAVMLYGDSIMEQLSVPIEDGLPASALVESRLKGGGGLADPQFDWIALAQARTKALKPKVSAVLLGGGDGDVLRNPLTGAIVPCCGDGWITAYSARIQEMLGVLTEGGGRAIWILNPIPDNPGRAPVVAAVGAAARRAVPNVPRSRIVDLASILSPGGVYTDTIVHEGRPVVVGAGDGLHLTVAGADIGAAPVLSAIGRLSAGKPCAGLKSTRLANCKTDQKVIRTCAAATGAKLPLCVKRVRALARCNTVKNKAKKRACIVKANAIGKRKS